MRRSPSTRSPARRSRATVSQIRNSSTTVQNVVTYDAVIDVENAALKLRPGMTATVTVIYAERPDAIAVSNAALRFRPPPEAASAVTGDAGAPPAHSLGHGGAAGSASVGRSHASRGLGRAHAAAASPKATSGGPST